MKHELQDVRLSKQLYENIRKELGKTIHQINLLKAEVTEEDIRKLRLSIKKIRIFFRWFEHLTKNRFANKQLFLLQKLFQSAVRLRDIQVQLSLINQYQTNEFYSFGDYRHQLDIAYQRQLSIFKKEIENFEIANLQKHDHIAQFLLFDVLSEKSILPQTVAHIHQRITQIHFLLKKPTTKNLHKIRILFKEVFYLLKILNKVHYSTPLLHLKIKSLKTFARQIGSWHDKTILQEALKDFNGMTNIKTVKEAIKTDVKLQKRVILEEFKTTILPLLEDILRLTKVKKNHHK